MRNAPMSWDTIFSRASIRYVLIFVLSLVLFIPPLIIVRLSYVNIKDELTQYSISRKQNTAKIGALIIKERLERAIDLAGSLSTRVQFQKYVASGAWEEAVEIIRRIPNQYDYVERIFLTDPSGTIWADTPSLGQTVGINFAHRDWYQGVSNGWKTYVSTIYERQAEPKYNVVAVASPIFDGQESQQVAGILVLQIRADTFFRWVQQIDIEPGGSLLVVDKTGTLVSGMAAGKTIMPAPMKEFVPVKELLAGNSGALMIRQPSGEQDILSVYESIPSFGWGVLSLYPGQGAFKLRNHILRTNKIIFTTFILVQFLLIAMLMRGLDKLILLSVSLRKARDELELRVAERTQELKDSHDKLVETNRDLEQFAYVASHDLQEPLRSITSFVQLFAKKYSTTVDEDGQNYIRYIVNGSKRMEQLIRDLLAYSRASGGVVKKEKVDANKALDEALANVSQLISERRARISRDKLPTVLFNNQLLARVFENLISNAIKYCKDRDPQVHIGAKEDAHYWVLSIKDNGIGIEEKYHDKIFDIFERLHLEDEYSGTGMGLAIIRRIIERHGGKISIASKVGEGSTFNVHISKKA